MMVETDWNTAGRNWDPAALAALYTEDALFFGGRPAHSIGAKSIRKYFESYVGVIDSCSLELVDQIVIELTSDCVIAQGYGIFCFSLQGKHFTRSRLRTTLALAKEGAFWKIRQHHFSAIPEAPPLGEPD
ncbi:MULTISPECIES: SgcJ/EcaC family oxidoreductase [unclassified Caballeronia]|uniref:YybH family protein n=1 Tax=unclassified Caballeronia TaxID=2646786 RepID=UPI002856B7D6|nr:MULTISPECIES: SgcJ/EcaC family oxidoreductase [unclassified Caballeronia]MDR5752383.1 SgcJ/EcaC family oxidoreductase [Caballeronia sp. LZ024]MDR5845188.1 SgcJ/EcaC family oxidoreductase [Caballeronia sp. LZ031]